jgi:hypothetical protein
MTIEWVRTRYDSNDPTDATVQDVRSFTIELDRR